MEIERPRSPNPSVIVATSVGLSRSIRPHMAASEIADELVLALRRLLPGRQIVLRLRAPGTHADVGYVLGTEGLAPYPRDTLWISRGGLALLGLSARDAIGQGLCVIEEYEPELERDACGFDVPLFDGASIAGVLGVEYERGYVPSLQDPTIVAQLALQAASHLAHVAVEAEPVSASHAGALDTLYERTRHVSLPPPMDAPHARERQVIQVEKLATLGQLAAGIVHELNNPLTSISMYSQHLRRRARQEESREEEEQIIGRIELAADRVLHLTRALMGYARPASEERAQVSIEKVVDRALLFCGHVLRSANVRAVKTGESGLPLVDGSEGHLQQVFVNLITNACHAMEPGGGELELRSALLPTGQLEVRVIDQGPGVDACEEARIFEPFYSTRPEGSGTGLGLSIVRTIVEQHGGSVSVERGEGDVGAVFVVTLPTAGGRTGVLLPPAV